MLVANLYHRPPNHYGALKRGSFSPALFLFRREDRRALNLLLEIRLPKPTLGQRKPGTKGFRALKTKTPDKVRPPGVKAAKGKSGGGGGFSRESELRAWEKERRAFDFYPQLKRTGRRWKYWEDYDYA